MSALEKLKNSKNFPRDFKAENALIVGALKCLQNDAYIFKLRNKFDILLELLSNGHKNINKLKELFYEHLVVFETDLIYDDEFKRSHDTVDYLGSSIKQQYSLYGKRSPHTGRYSSSIVADLDIRDNFGEIMAWSKRTAPLFDLESYAADDVLSFTGVDIRDVLSNAEQFNIIHAAYKRAKKIINDARPYSVDFLPEEEQETVEMKLSSYLGDYVTN
ncbi:MAG: hypothetical protein FWD89_00150 [Firmicutes bacterium]|nr:hypothetical protein [Bacillota bacterium]MCL2770714.1 hypothetical protein [Bacillota bacterium]